LGKGSTCPAPDDENPSQSIEKAVNLFLWFLLSDRSDHDFAPLRSTIGIMEEWSVGMMGLEEKIKNDLYAFITHYSIIPLFRVVGT
jgi:hypothetical protein